jgi:hypothetical protein
MIELEVQALSVTREGLLIDVGKVVVACGFTLQRQRLVQDPNGVLMTLVVRGPARKQRALEQALEANERIISFEISLFEEGVSKPHFAAARTFARTAPPAPVVEPVAPPAAEPPKAVAQPAPAAAPVEPVAQAPLQSAPARVEEPEADTDFMLLLEPKSAPAPAPAAIPVEPFVEMIPLGPDVGVVEALLPRLQYDYPKVLPVLEKLQQSVEAAARESSLLLAGQRLGAWVFARDHGTGAKLELPQAIERIGVPAMSDVVQVAYKGEGLHIHDSPLCTPGHSGCKFFSGYLEGLLGPALPSGALSIFEVCCRSYGADACILAISEG